MRPSFKKLLLGYKFKIMASIVATLTVITIFSFSLTNYKTKDKVPDLSFLTREEQKEMGPFATKVKAGLHIKNFTKFDVIKNNFVMDAVVWFEFSPGEMTIATIEKFSFLNGEIKRKSSPNIKMIEGRVFVKYEVTVEFFSDLKFPYFPYEYHRLPILLTNVYIPTEGMIFITSDAGFTIDPGMSISNWVIDDTTTDYGYREARFDLADDKKVSRYSIALFMIDFSSFGVKHALIIFIPILFSLLLGLFSLFVPLYEKLHLGLGFATASVTSLLGYRFVIENIIPKVGYTTTTDAVYTFALTMVFIPFFMQLIAAFVIAIRISMLGEAKVKAITEELDLVFTYVFIVLFLASTFFLYKTLIL